MNEGGGGTGYSLLKRQEAFEVEVRTGKEHRDSNIIINAGKSA